jgi:hypothetical protein
MQASVDAEADMARVKPTRRKADLEEDFDLLQQEKEAAVAEAEAYAYDEASSRPDFDLQQEGSQDRTKSYVSQHVQSGMSNNPEVKYQLYTPSFNPSATNDRPTEPVANMFTKSYVSQHVQSGMSNNPEVRHQLYAPSLNPSAHNYCPTEPVANEPVANEPVASMFSKFMIKKDLLLSRLVKFTDEPELFDMWRSSFHRIITELGVSEIEELELLTKWLGPESSGHALNLRAANAKNPELGIWERLDVMYAIPEMVDSSIKKKLSSFVKISKKDPKRFFDLSDIVTEIASLKETPEYETLLGYYDSSTGVTPIVNKLPPNLQEKWTNEAIKYKRRYQVAYPPPPLHTLRQFHR